MIIQTVLLGLVLAGLVVVFVLQLRAMKGPQSQDIGGEVARALQSSGVLTRLGEFEARTQEISRAQQALIPRFEQLQELTAQLAEHTRNVEASHKGLEQLLKVPASRGAFGELALERILTDQLPPGMFGIRKRIAVGTPDAYIKAPEGVICIDSKFPLTNFENAEKAQDPDEKARFVKQFLKDAKGHMEKVMDYVQPDKGTAPFAFVFIPSEAVYHFLLRHGFDLVMEYAKKGIQVSSPLTLTPKLELIRASVNALHLSEKAEEIHRQLQAVARGFADLDKQWRVFYETHLRNLTNKAEAVEQAYSKLRTAFDKVEEPGSTSGT
jgi:DNA recombination protein RmuC